MKKAILISIVVIAVLITGGYFYLKMRKSKDFEPLLKAKLQEVVRDASDSLYVLSIGKLEVDVVGAEVKASDLQLSVDSARLKVLMARGTAPVDVYKISLSDLNIDGLSVADLLNKKNISLDLLNLRQPTVEIFHPVNKNRKAPPDTATLYSRIAKNVGHFKLRDLSITNMNFIYHNIEGEEKQSAFKDVSMRFTDIEIDSLTQYDTTRFLYARNAFIYLHDYVFRTADSLYLLQADSLTLQAAQRKLSIKGLALKPRYSKQTFGRQLKFYKDRYDVKFASASFEDVDWYNLFLGEGFSAGKATFSNGSMEVFADKNVPPSPKSKIGNYPHQLLMRLDLPVAIDTLLINDFSFKYRELNAKTQATGEVNWENISGKITNITNIPEKIAANKTVRVAASSRLFDAGNFDVVFNFDLTKAETGDFTVDITLGPMNGLALNKAAKPLGMFEVNSLSIKKLKAHIVANNYRARSSVLFVYDDLKITALQKDEETRKFKKKKFLSFFANFFVLNKSNTMDEAQPEYVTYKRDAQRSFFSLIWKSVLTGITGTAS